VKVCIIILLFLALNCWADNDNFQSQLVEAAREQTEKKISYDGSYRRINYPMGDVPDNVGVCTDLIIRSYRKLGIDLQELVHLDMQANFSHYPKIWGLSTTDTNIDHRRVPNLQVYFKRHGEVLLIDRDVNNYRAGDLLTWLLPGNLPHIGIVSNQTVAGTQRPKIIHNIGKGPVEDDILFKYAITGHYRYALP